MVNFVETTSPKTLAFRSFRLMFCDRRELKGPATDTLGHTRAIRWSSPIRKVARTVPMNFRPYSDFCCHTP